MTLEELSAKILDAVEEFDASAAPFGLYAARDILLEPRPKEVLGDFLTLKDRRPDLAEVNSFIIEMKKISEWAKHNEIKFRFTVPELGLVELLLVRTSKIKVRKFGSGYCLDKQEDFAYRWEKLELGDSIRWLWTRSDTFPLAQPDVKMLLFLGFARNRRPFQEELEALKSYQNREAHGVSFGSRQWEDRFERKFWVRAALWTRQVEG